MKRSRIAIGCLALLILAGLSRVQTLPAQPTTTTAKRVERPKTDIEGLVTDFREGALPIRDTSKNVTNTNLAAINSMAEWIVYRLTNPEASTDSPPTGPSPGRITALVEDSRRYFWFPWSGPTSPFPTAIGAASTIPLPWRSPNDNQKAYVEEFGKAMVKHLKDVTKNDKPIVRVNAARLMTLVAQSGYAGMTDWLLEILTAPAEPLELKIYALESLRYLLAIRRKEKPNATIFTEPANLTKITEVLLNIVTEKPDFQVPAAGSPEANSNAGKDAIDKMRVFMFRRRKAIEAVAALPVGVIADDLGRISVRPVHTLMMIALNDTRIEPPVTMRERVEAMIGVLNMVPDEKLNVDYAVFGMAKVLQELVRERSQGLNSVPWKQSAARIKEAFNHWRELAKLKNVANKQMIIDLDRIASELLTPVIDKGLEAQVDANKLNQWITDNPLKVNSLFMDDPKLFLDPR